MTNPLLEHGFRIPWDRIRAEHVVPAVREGLAAAEAELRALVAAPGPRSYASTVERLDALLERLERTIGPAQHLVDVANTPELRAAYQQVLPEFSAWYARLPLDPGLWGALRDFADTPEAAALGGVRRRHLDKTLREFVRAGADLPPGDKVRVEQVRVELSQLHTEFSNHALDATNAWELVVTEPAELAGLPDSTRAQARASAAAKGLDGWRFTLQIPSYQPFMQRAEARELRRHMYTAYMNRAAGGDHDNRPLITRILRLRRELAETLGFADFADFRLAENMAGSAERAAGFLRDLAARTRPFWQRETAALREFAGERLGIDTLEPWDTAFVAERMRRASFELDEEELRPFFPLPRVLEGLWEVTRRLFGVVVTERPITEVWHPDVRFYDVHDEETGTYLGAFYADWFPRESKRSGAWMNALITGGPRPDATSDWTPHLGLMVANFSPPEGIQPALLTHREVQTVFHEWGHLLHHLLSRVEVPARAGTNVARDWVELPSQILENWSWERPALDLFARHWETGEPLPDSLLQRMLAARRFMAATHQMRQLSFAILDLELHTRYDPERDGPVVPYAQRVMERFAMRPEFARNHFITAFTHVFAGGYAAGYYSYLWSETLDADAFGRFEREGIFSRETGRAYVDAILSRGDSADPAELFREFLGRDPDPSALLRRNLGEEAARFPAADGAHTSSARMSA